MDGLLAYSLASGGSQANRATGVACLLAASALSSPAAARSKRADRLFLVMGLVAPARSSRACGAGSCARCVFCKEASTMGLLYWQGACQQWHAGSALFFAASSRAAPRQRAAATSAMAFVLPAALPRRAPPSRARLAARKCTSASASASPPALPPRVVPSPLPTLLVYDHCPFCVRVRHLLGLKNVKYNLLWLANDDAHTPHALVGRKVVPIFQPHGAAGDAHAESLHICAMVDADARFGERGLLAPQSQRTDIAQWMEQLAMPMRRLTRVRFSRAPLPEFVFADARHAYVSNHPLKDPASYEHNWDNSAQYIAHIQSRLAQLADMIESPYYCSPHGLSYDDITLFPRLRSLTIIKGLQLPSAIRHYVEYHARVAEIPLYDYCAM
eukprot:TRINITY_DN2593_c0_g1_i5.p1 TRINITY_DN2593_c0_g1~~TRINITY_DN2593_c0_g1_i5.p1  ORF type:complete len:385 (+),score=85.76 TRINITY_DN2593_c0_g1_i5:330-1484(+)